jgi:ABC-type oligopeptide transport system substrate-binding subunit
MNYPADEGWYDNLLTANAGQNYTAIKVPAAAHLVAQANVSLDPQAAAALYRQAEQRYVNQVAWFVLDQPYNAYVVRPKVIGYARTPPDWCGPRCSWASTLVPDRGNGDTSRHAVGMVPWRYDHHRQHRRPA